MALRWCYYFVTLAISARCAAGSDRSWVCKPPSDLRASENELKDLISRNCEKVNRTAEDFLSAIQSGTDRGQKELWLQESREALTWCDFAEGRVSKSAIQKLPAPPEAVFDEIPTIDDRAYIAVNAWGSILMGGRQCCTLLEAPFCLVTSWSSSTLILLVPIFLVIAGIIALAAFRAHWQPKPKPAAALPAAAASAAPVQLRNLGVGGSPSSRRDAHGEEASLLEQLKERWLRSSCLRVLPQADNFASAAASMFVTLQETFGFQADNARNQFEHLMSLWRSHCALEADGLQETALTLEDWSEADGIAEDGLLRDALHSLHKDLLEDFLRWQALFHGYDCFPARETAEMPLLGGAPLRMHWRALKRSACGQGATETASAELSAKLAEVATYLLVWGEAGNLRFMPEVIYFITQLLLDAEPLPNLPGETPCFGSALRSGSRAALRSGKFLSSVVRPLYNVVFDEWYEGVSVDETTQKDRKTLHRGYEAFLPPDVDNYDDWNELFCDPARITERLVLDDGHLFFLVPPQRRLMDLSRVDWQQTFQAAEIKTHREIHSLWGVFAATHRIWFLHAVLFACGASLVAEGRQPRQVPGIEGVDFGRFASVGLLVPLFAALSVFARWQVTGRALRSQRCRGICCGCSPWQSFCWIAPLVTYVAIYFLYEQGTEELVLLSVCWAVHYSASIFGIFLLLFVPDGQDNVWSLSPVAFRVRAVRYFFWICILATKFMLGLEGLSAMFSAIRRMKITAFAEQTPHDLGNILRSGQSAGSLLLWMLMWATSFFFYVTDTQLFFVIGCAFWGTAIVFYNRGLRKGLSFITEDAVAKIPEHLTKKVFPFAEKSNDLQTRERRKDLSTALPYVWDRIIEYMRCEDKIDNEVMSNLSFIHKAVGDTNANLTKPLVDLGRTDNLAAPGFCRSGCGRRVQAGLDKSGLPYQTCCRSCARKPGKAHDRCCSAAGAIRRGELSPHSQAPLTARSVASGYRNQGQAGSPLKLPDLFRYKKASEIFCQHYGPVGDELWPKNPDVQWRIIALARGLGQNIPRPFRAPYIPGLTVLIPHYAESLRMDADELFKSWQKRDVGGVVADNVPLMDWLKSRHPLEFSAFADRMQIGFGTRWEDYGEAQWEQLSSWSSMRMQTLWRTVSGMCLYHPALQCHYEVQGADIKSRLAHPGVWDPSECFTCLVSMQQYAHFEKDEVADTNRMLHELPDCLKIAYIDYAEKGPFAAEDCVHARQERRYFSCLIDRHCESRERNMPDGRKRPRFRIELPGYPILGDGKGDNQNHAMPFMRGSFAQCIDANQGAYFEQMLMLPCVLGEFRGQQNKRIVGLPEHITSDIGSVGDMAASAEMAFGTILQRSMAVLGARMHYGHPDIMNKQCMMRQGGVSKATKTLNLSEDIFAGMDFLLRGDGREILHCEYFHLAKGRDLGFNTVLAFFSKLASGAGEQIITRQMFRLGQGLHLPEALTFYYAHVGYYFNQFFISWSMPLLTCVWLLVLLSDCEHSFESLQSCDSEVSRTPNAEIMAETVSKWFSWLVLLFLLATSLPLLAELWLERSLKTSIKKMLVQLLTLSPLLFVFQSKTIGSYVVNELRFGGATYVSTGRGLPTERRPFIRYRGKIHGLYLDYAALAFYDGVALMMISILILLAGGISDAGSWHAQLPFVYTSVGLTVASWLYAPFLFNPYMFSPGSFWEDLRSCVGFFAEEGGKNWITWYTSSQLRPEKGRRNGIDAALLISCFFLCTWGEVMYLKVQAFAHVYVQVDHRWAMWLTTFVPPMGASLLLCMLVPMGSAFFSLLGSCCRREPAAEEVDVEAQKSTSGADGERDPDGDSAICCSAAPLALISIVVVVLDVLEAAFTLRDFQSVGWTDAVLAGATLKYLVLSYVLCWGEDLLRSSSFQKLGCFATPLQLWVRSHRMCRDMLTSSLILGALAPFVFFNSLNVFFCPGCSIHQLLIFRDHKPPARQDFDRPKMRQRRRDIWKSVWKSEKTAVSERSHRTSVLGSERTFRSEKTYRSERTDMEGETPHAEEPKTPQIMLNSALRPEILDSSRQHTSPVIGSPIDGTPQFTFAPSSQAPSSERQSSRASGSDRMSGSEQENEPFHSVNEAACNRPSARSTGISRNLSMPIVPEISGFGRIPTVTFAECGDLIESSSSGGSNSNVECGLTLASSSGGSDATESSSQGIPSHTVVGQTTLGTANEDAGRETVEQDSCSENIEQKSNQESKVQSQSRKPYVCEMPPIPSIMIACRAVTKAQSCTITKESMTPKGRRAARLPFTPRTGQQPKPETPRCPESIPPQPPVTLACGLCEDSTVTPAFGPCEDSTPPQPPRASSGGLTRVPSNDSDGSEEQILDIGESVIGTSVQGHAAVMPSGVDEDDDDDVRAFQV